MNVGVNIFQEIWHAFIKWSKSQLDLDRTISIPNFGNIAYKKGDET